MGNDNFPLRRFQDLSYLGRLADVLEQAEGAGPIPASLINRNASRQATEVTHAQQGRHHMGV